ncbi:hypothetical protein DOTSEDRAFT_24130 [Dothistroma septosporum NZE10]|uniref:Uncharacterized protein n=1 Tax=Dothistroma septosporum (strain NZE10 / CBS 128990) TaxID=675120 RepID=N1PKK7_DOTSN|nr:hypothetical protein DOTSEDRAFT_24130 [Dothistroma septosporum NZE10]
MYQGPYGYQRGVPKLLGHRQKHLFNPYFFCAVSLTPEPKTTVLCISISYDSPHHHNHATTARSLEYSCDYTTTNNVCTDTYPAISPLKADLTNKSIFVSGASKGLGKPMAISLATAGAKRGP